MLGGQEISLCREIVQERSFFEHVLSVPAGKSREVDQMQSGVGYQEHTPRAVEVARMKLMVL